MPGRIFHVTGHELRREDDAEEHLSLFGRLLAEATPICRNVAAVERFECDVMLHLICRLSQARVITRRRPFEQRISPMPPDDAARPR